MVEPGGGDEATAGTADPLQLVRQATGSEAGTALEAIRQLRPLLDEWERQQVERARSAGWNWAEIAKRLGRHRQAVHREYAAPRRPKP
jgi:transcriptional regulator with GAF, ATPase, and Fis domain